MTKNIIALISLSLLLCQSGWAGDGDLSVKAKNHEGGVVTFSLISGREYSFTATANDGYTFWGWSDGVTTATRTYTHPENEENTQLFRAIFTKNTDVNPKYGTVSVTIEDPTQPTYKLTASPIDPSSTSFYRWNNGVSVDWVYYNESEGTRIPYFLSSGGDLSVLFTQREGGVVDAIQESGRTYTMTASANEGYTFIGWSDNLDPSLTSREYTHSAGIAEPVPFHAVFTKDADVQQTLGYTTVRIKESATPEYYLKAVPNGDDVTFVKWNNGSEVEEISYMESEGTRIPLFLQTANAIAVKALNHPGGSVTPTKISTREYSFTAVANDGYTFWGWSDGDKSATRTYTHNAGVPDKSFYAVFTKDADMNLEGGTTTVSVKDANVPSFNLTANPKSDANCGMSFYKWNNKDATNPLIAYEESDGYRVPIYYHTNALEYTRQDNEGGTINVTPLECGYTLEAVPNNGFQFIQWEDDKSTVATRDVDYLAASYTATFGQANFKVGEEYFINIEDAALAAGSESVELINNVDNVIVNSSVNLFTTNKEITNLTINNGGSVDLKSALTVTNLYLNGTSGSSAQLLHSSNLNYDKAYFDITLEAGKSKASPDLWYAIAVPFDVDVETGISRADGSGTHISEVDYLVWRYDGKMRGENADGNGWVEMHDGTMHAGQIYMIGIDGNANTWRFEKNSSSELEGPGSIALKENPSVHYTDRGWNGVANSTLFYADASVESGIMVVQAYVNGATTPRYDPYRLDEKSLVVASPFFVQTAADDLLEFDEASHSSLLVPKRKGQQQDIYYKVMLSCDSKDLRDVVYLTADENAENQYQIGKDVMKMVGGNTNMYLWTNAYGYRLCAQDAPIVDNHAEYQLGMYAPQDLACQISVDMSHEASIYLLDDGIAIWNLSESPYSMDLKQGTTSRYSLSVELPNRGISTGINQTYTNGITRKFIRSNQLYIQRGDLFYNAQGVMIK